MEYPATNPEAPVFSFITTCKGRLHHLQQTLPLMVQQADSEVIVVDYGCPQKTGDWVAQHYPQVKVVRVADDEGFCISRARNLGAQAASAEWLIFIDADILLAEDLLSWLSPRLALGNFFRAGITHEKMDNFGTYACHRDDFAKAGGYDELLRGWGMEDNDMYYRLRITGCTQHFFPENLINPIPHGNELRTQFSLYKNRWVSQFISSLYLQMKYDVASLQQAPASLEMRQKLYEHARASILRMINQGESGTTITLELGDHPGLPSMNPIWGINRTLAYTVQPRKTNQTP